jgi:hypothetical protein
LPTLSNEPHDRYDVGISVEMPTLPALADDGALVAAVAVLDEKLSAFAGALEQGNSTLIELARRAGMAVEPEPAKKAKRGGFVTQSPAGEPVETPPPPPKVSERAVTPPSPPSAGPATEPEEDDEALLRTLEPELAKAIRVKRRLGKKSVRELLEEMKSAKPRSGDAAGPQQQTGKGWWR